MKRNDDIVFKLKSGGHLAKHFKIRIALLNHLNQVVLEWTSNAVLYHGSIPNPEMLEPANAQAKTSNGAQQYSTQHQMM